MPRSSRRPQPSPVKRLVGWGLVTIAVMLLALAGWIRYRFGAVSLEQIISNLPIGPGKGIGNNGLAVEAVTFCIAAPAVLVGAVAIGERRIRRRISTVRGARFVPVTAFIVGLAVLLGVAGVPEYAIAQLSEQTLASYYVTPAVTSAPSKPKNLITIYLESTENTFGDSELMGQNLLVNLDDATKGWANYRGLEQYTGGGWTMAGLVSTQCGIPLKSQLTVEGLDYNKMGEQVDHYLPGATCLGDVLTTQGYTNVFVGGADDDFAGKKTFLSDHGYSRVYGLADWKADGEDPDQISESWGLSDARMTAHALDVLKGLHASGRPFNLTMLTLDTHEPAGIFPGCSSDDQIAMATAIKCSTRAVERFLDAAKARGYLDDTVVMVMGDHLKGTGDHDSFRDALLSAPHRTIVFRVWSPDGVVQYARESADQLSVLPSTLELLGFGVDEGRAGVGVSFVRPHDLAGTALALPSEEYRTLLLAPSSELYRGFWAG